MSDPSVPAPDSRNAGSHYQPSLVVVLMIVVLFVGATFLMVRAVSPATGTTTTSSTTTPSHHATHSHSHSHSSALVRSTVRVQVANGTLTTGLAGSYTQRLMTLGWNTLPAGNAARATATVVYYNPGFLKAAQDIASEIGVARSAIKPLGGLNPITGSATDDVIIVLGPNSATG